MAKKGFGTVIETRSKIIMIMIVLIGLPLIAFKLFYMQTIQAESLQKSALNQQLHTTTINAKRGNIYDRNGNLLAQSMTTWEIVIEPANFNKYSNPDKARNILVEGLSSILDVDKNKLMEMTKKNRYDVKVKSKVDTETKDQVAAFENYISDKYGMTNIIDIFESYKRFYTHDNFAGPILGFINDENVGTCGIECYYEKELKGTPGKEVISKDVNGKEMPFPYEQKIPAQDGYNLTLTIDETIQSIMEKYVRETIKEFNVANRGCAIMMEVKTGKILGFACEESFNPNDPYYITNRKLAAEIKKLPEDKQSEAIGEAQMEQWKNKGVNDTYIPGSVFKMVTASAVLSEGYIEKDTRFNCDGAYAPFEGSGLIDCWLTSGHGSQTLEEALCNSCNPAFMQMGFMLGREKFYEYYVSFGMSEPTGIDLPGESDDVFFHNEGIHGMDLTDLAVASFGQNFKITPIQMVTACAAIANEGKLLTPYVVDRISDSNGNVVKTNETTVKRQAISADVAKQMCEMLERNAVSGGATNGYVPGYRIGGKTGTSQKKEESGEISEDYIASFCGIAPCDDPQIALLCYFDTPDESINYYGAGVAGPCFRNIMTEVLPYLGIERQYSDAELAQLDTITDAYVGMDISTAKSVIEDAGLKAEIVGKGETVTGQNPEAYVTIPKEGTVVIYTEENPVRDASATVPDFTNCTMSEANHLAAEHNINLCLTGSRLSSDHVSYAKSQDIKPGTKVEPYTVVTVTFNQDDALM